jgi:hypothetical protein
MDTESPIQSGVRVRQPRNWWKYAFFLMLILFEGAREFAVLTSDTKATPNVQALMFSSGPPDHQRVNAQGTWQRVDGGGNLSSTTVAIECDQDKAECLEVTATMIDKYVFVPDVMRFDAKFGSDYVSYENDFPACVRISVRLDLKLQKVFAVRERKRDAKEKPCANLEDRIEMQLGATHYEDSSLDGHFLPLMRILRLILGN